MDGHPEIALAICYEISVPEHQAAVGKSSASVYVASVAKSAAGVARSYETLSSFAAAHKMSVLMANNIGPSDDFVGAGQSAIWGSKGELLCQLDSEQEGLLVLDTATGQVAALR